MDEQRLQAPFGGKKQFQAHLVLHQMAFSYAPMYPIAGHLFIKKKDSLSFKELTVYETWIKQQLWKSR